MTDLREDADLPTNFLSMIELGRALENAVDWYEKDAPTVAAFADDLYQRINDKKPVLLDELLGFQSLFNGANWMHPNYAANHVYKLQHRLGQDTTGHAGF